MVSNNLPDGWDRQFCRQVINQLRDGLPPPAKALSYVSVGTEHYLKRARKGLLNAAMGKFDSTILIGRYGVGKSHLLRRVQVLAEEDEFEVRLVAIGSSVYFNSPETIAKSIAGNINLPMRQEFYFDNTFVMELNHIAHQAMTSKDQLGLVILIDEAENTFNSSNLPRFASRIKAYRYLNTLFCGYSSKPEYRDWLKNIYVMIAITPGVLEYAMREPPGRYYKNDLIENPAMKWKKKGGLPDQIEIEPLTSSEGLELVQRICAIHSMAFSWDAAKYIDSEQVNNIVQEWLLMGVNRDERQLVKSIIETLEITEQGR